MKLKTLSLASTGLAVFLMGAAPPAERISFQKAQQNALRECIGKVKTSGLEQLDRVWVYTFEIRSKAKRTCIISVDALSGKLRSKELVSGEK